MWRLAFVLGVGLLASACVSSASRIAALNAEGVRVFPSQSGWYELRSEDGYRFGMPGLPEARRYDGHAVAGVAFRLEAEGRSRMFLLQVFNLRGFPNHRIEQFATEAEARYLSEGRELASENLVDHRGVRAREVEITNVGRNGHSLLVRTVIWGGRVYQLAAAIPAGAGAPGDVRTFFDSLVLPPEDAAQASL